MQDFSFRPLSLTGQTAWQDLLRLLKDEAASEVTGKLVRRQIKGRFYLYDRYRLGAAIRERYLGEDKPELRQRLEHSQRLRDDSKSRQKETARLVRLLRSEGYLTPDLASGQILQAMARVGVFRLGGTIIGTHAFRSYEGILGIRIGADQAAQTNDIDIAKFEHLSLALNDTVDPPLQSVFADLKFAPLPSLEPSSTWRWQQTEQKTLVEFLTPSFSEDEGLRDLPSLGVSAQSLHFLNYLIASPVQVPLLYRSGSLIQVPRPERYAIHKLIVADRRRGEDIRKAHKDRAQAAFLIAFLAEEQPESLEEAYSAARESGPAWRDAIDKTLKLMPRTAAILARLDA